MRRKKRVTLSKLLFHRKKLKERSNQTNFTLIELLVVIAIIAILSSILLPTLKSARDKSKQIACANNLKQVSLATAQYLNDFNEVFPDSSQNAWTWKLSKVENPGLTEGWGNYLPDTMVYECPSSSGEPRNGAYTESRYRIWGIISYSMENRISEWPVVVTSYPHYSLRTITKPTIAPLIWDRADSVGQVLPVSNPTHGLFVQYPPFYRHNASANVVFVDGHVENLRTAPPSVWDIRYNQ